MVRRESAKGKKTEVRSQRPEVSEEVKEESFFGCVPSDL
jgi:hypothetical protein